MAGQRDARERRLAGFVADPFQRWPNQPAQPHTPCGTQRQLQHGRTQPVYSPFVAGDVVVLLHTSE